MDGSELLDRVREANETELGRLGSERALVATTAASLDSQTVIETAAAAERRATETFEQWIEDEPNEGAREAFETAARTERDHLDRVCEFGGIDPGGIESEPDALHERLRGYEETAERVGAGLIARPLVASRSLLQVINFYTNEGDTAGAELFRELRADTDDQIDAGVAVADATLSDGEFERAADAAGETIDSAYEEYAETLESMGIDPKPVC